jgi:hypothetical protein
MRGLTCRRWPHACLAVGLLLLLTEIVVRSPLLAHAQSSKKVLEDFHAHDAQGFPDGWDAQRSKATAQEAYRVQKEEQGAFLAARGADQRVFKRIAWDPKAYPVVTWKWRLNVAPSSDNEPMAAVFISLDTDLFVIPVSTKYSWSKNKPKGTTTDGGIFGASEIVVRSGTQPIGQWVEERVNAYEDFKRLHDHEPAPEAWGVSLLAGSGVDVDFGPLTASPE